MATKSKSSAPKGAGGGKQIASRPSQPLALADLVRVVAMVGLGATAYVLLPIVENPTVVFGSLVARAVVAGCVVGLLGTQIRTRWVVPACAAGASLLGCVGLGALDGLYLNGSGLLLGLVVGAALAFAVAALGWAGQKLVAQIGCVVVVLLVALWFAGVFPGPLTQQAAQLRTPMLSAVPQPEQYNFDGRIYLRTYYLMKAGGGYYQSFRRALADDQRYTYSSLVSPFNYREPLLFEFWKVLPGSDANALFDWFVVWSLLTMGAAYALSSALVEPGVALLAPIALVRFFYFLYWVGSWFTMAEVWAVGIAIAAFAALMRKQRILSLALLIVAVAAREFMIVFVPVWIVVWWMSGPKSRKASWWFPAVAAFGPVAVIAIHVLSVPPLSPGATGALGASAWLHSGFTELITALRFSWSSTLTATQFPQETMLPIFIVLIAIAAAALAKPRWRMAALVVATTLPLLFLFALRGNVWEYYWGGFYTPLAAAIAPGVLGRWMPARSWSDDAGR